MSGPMLEVCDVRKRYGATVALDGVRFSVETGELFGLLGPNGAGKTSLLSIISGVLRPDGGCVQIAGRTVTPGDRGLRHRIGIVPQDLAIYGDLTARENLAFFGELYDVRGESLRRRVGEVLAAIGLEDRADSRAATFSGGMKRRLNLGAAIVHRPDVLLLDEPTTGVDPQSRNHLFEEVRRLNREGMTIVYTSHYMEEVQALCPRAGIMDHGRLIACDAVANLLRQLDSTIRFRVSEIGPALRERLKQLPQARLTEPGGGDLELECRDVKATLPLVIAALNELHLDLSGLEMEEPNLERVFLHLTGRALRD
jgi:ABC-2 type transport system ATP-binding protein